MAEIYKIDELKAELDHLLKQQSETLESRVLGGASDTEIIEYDIRQEVISEIQGRLARSKAS
jgi:hypothetical protein